MTTTALLRKHPNAKCEECPLLEDSVFVPSDGPDKADIVLVGEAPGLNEGRQGKPFVGASGKLLNRILSNSGIDREEVFITNVCLCRPKDNANPPVSAIKACSERLKGEIDERGATTIVALGNFAAKAITGSTRGITKLRVGPPKTSDKFPGVRIIPTFHPAASLYNADVFPDIVTDFGKIKGESNVRVLWSPPEIKIFDDRIQADRVLQELRQLRTPDVALDIEVGFEKDEHFIHPDRYRLLCVGISHRANTAVVIGENALRNGGVQNQLGGLIGDKGIIAQNGKFDLAGLYYLNPEGAKHALSFDTMLAHYTVDERRGTHSLDQLAIEFLGSPDWKSEVHRYLGSSKNYADIPRDVLYKYNAYDASNTFLLKDYLSGRMESEDTTELHEFLVRSSSTLMMMELNGVAVDMDYLDQLTEEYLNDIEAEVHDLKQMVELPDYNPNSWQQVQQVLKDVFLVPKSRVPNTRKETIAGLQGYAAKKGNKDLYSFCEKHLKYKEDAKAYGTYIKGIRSRIYRGRVHPSFLLHGTVTGRLSSRNPNLQNIPRDSKIRRQFVATDTDHVLIQADYRQAELRVVACMARDAYLRDVLSNPARDIHSEVATRFFGTGFTKDQRVRAKAVVFGLTYGREAYSLAMEYGWSIREAQTYINEFFELIPDVVRWRQETIERVMEGGDLVTPFGRHRRYWLITKENHKDVIKESYAFLPQSTASDINLEAANRLARLGLWDYLRIPVHDAIIFEMPKDRVTEVIPIIRHTMEEVGEEVFDGYLPFPVDITMGQSWGDLD